MKKVNASQEKGRRVLECFQVIKHRTHVFDIGFEWKLRNDPDLKRAREDQMSRQDRFR